MDPERAGISCSPHPTPPESTGKWASQGWISAAASQQDSHAPQFACGGPARGAGSHCGICQAVSCVCRARALRGCGRGSFRPWASWQLFPGKNPPPPLPLVLLPLLSRVGSDACSQGAGPFHPPGFPCGGHAHQLRGPSWPAPHRAALSLCCGPPCSSCSVTYPVCCQLGWPSFSPTQGLSPPQCPILAGRAGGHTGPGSPSILSPGVQCLVATGSLVLAKAVGNWTHFWNASSPRAGPTGFSTAALPAPRAALGMEQGSGHMGEQISHRRGDNTISLPPARMGTFALSPWNRSLTSGRCVVGWMAERLRGGRGRGVRVDLGELQKG